MEEESASDSDREKYEDKWFSGMMKGLSCRTGKIDPDLSGKVVFLLELLKLAAKKREKVLVFTQSLVCIELMERILDFEVDILLSACTSHFDASLFLLSGFWKSRKRLFQVGRVDSA